MTMLRRLLAWWRNRPCYTECYPEGWRHGIMLRCDECDRLHEIDIEDRQRQREEARRLATRPEVV